MLVENVPYRHFRAGFRCSGLTVADRTLAGGARVVLLSVLSAGLGIASGCLPPPKLDHAIRRAAIELPCPASELQAKVIAELSTSSLAVVDVLGCGRQVRYACLRTDGTGRAACTREPSP